MADMSFIQNYDAGQLRAAREAANHLPDSPEKAELLQAIADKMFEKSKALTIYVDYDSDTGNPLDPQEKSWRVVSFNSRHIGFEHPDIYFDDGLPNEALQTLLNAGKAWLLSYYEHGQGAWFLKGTGSERGLQCQWDTAQTAGILFADPDWHETPERPAAKTVEEILSEYNDWYNGNCYYYSIINDCKEALDSCGGFVGRESLIDHLREEHEELFQGDYLSPLVTVTGPASFVLE